MATATKRRTRRSRGSLDAEMILQGAFEVASREGLDGMSMPTLAAHLNVGVTSIYWYFRNKEDLLQQMFLRATESLNSRISVAEGVDPGQWRSHLLEVFQQIRAVFAEDDVLAELLLHRQAGHSGQRPESVFDGVESEMVMMVAAGFPLKTAWQVYSTLWMYTHGMATNERARRRSAYPPPGTSQLSMVDVTKTPLLARLIADEGASLDMTDTTGDAFLAGLDLILDSAEMKLAVHR